MTSPLCTNGPRTPPTLSCWLILLPPSPVTCISAERYHATFISCNRDGPCSISEKGLQLSSGGSIARKHQELRATPCCLPKFPQDALPTACWLMPVTAAPGIISVLGSPRSKRQRGLRARAECVRSELGFFGKLKKRVGQTLFVARRCSHWRQREFRQIPGKRSRLS